MNADQLREKLEARVARIPFHECWEWTGARDDQGYPRFYIVEQRVYVPAHRLALFLDGRPIPPGYCGCHHCDNTSCIRPLHLFVGTQGENNTDRHRKGRTFNRPGIDASRRMRMAATHCQRGHLRTPENVYVNSRGYRECRPCRYAAVQRHRARIEDGAVKANEEAAA